MKRSTATLAITTLTLLAATPAFANDTYVDYDSHAKNTVNNRSDNSNDNSNRNSNKSSNRNDNSNKLKNTNKNSNHQGQTQKQAQSQLTKVKSGNNNGNVRNAGNNTGNSASHSRADQQNANVSAGNTTTIQQQRNPVSSATAAALTSGNDSCMGSSSGGLQGAAVGVSFGSTWTDDNCVLLKNSTMLWNIGKQDAAVALLCSNPKLKEALEVSGTDCPQSGRRREEAKKPTWDATDPYIARRMAQEPENKPERN